MPIHFFIGNEDKVQRLSDPDKQINFIKGKLSELLEIKNLSFLLGAGCSSLKVESREVGIPAMAELAQIFIEEFGVQVKVVAPNYKGGEISNLESFLGYLYKKYQVAKEEGDAANITSFEEFIKETKKFILKKCKSESAQVKEIYKIFYRKLLLRSGNLPRVNVFTTNYDLYNEVALDDLGIIYCNGFSGFIERRFNPTIFKHTLYNEIDIKNGPLTQVDNFIFLYKLHGSINWEKDELPKSFFDLKEVQRPEEDNSFNAMIYPTPQKQEDSFGVPYSDLFREFQNKINQNSSVLICVGYGLNDDHVNNIIFRSLTLPTFRLVILGDPEKESLKKLRDLNDSRIWIIGGKNEDQKLHYFDGFVDKILPDINQEQMEKQMRTTEEGLLNMERLKDELNA